MPNRDPVHACIKSDGQRYNSLIKAFDSDGQEIRDLCVQKCVVTYEVDAERESVAAELAEREEHIDPPA